MRITTNHTLLLRLTVFTALLLPLGCGDDVRVPIDSSLPDADTSVMPDGALPDGPVPDGMVEMCEPGLVDCGDGCTRLAGDSAHCGACGNACPSGFSCAIGRRDCEEPLLSCDGTCTDPAIDTNNCGACGNVCREGDICLEGACVIDCEAPNQRCPGTETDLICSDPQTDSTNCGVCGAACSSGATCTDGSCSCGEGQISCDGSCVDPTTDATYCGDCITNCGVDGVCMDGACSTCGAGLAACGAVARCTDTDESLLHCGECDNACAPGAGCTAGACGCNPEFTDSDRNHCGACDNPCGSGEVCRESTCMMLNNTCATATPITADTTIAGESIADGSAPPSGDDCGSGSGSTALYYAVTVPPGQRVTANVPTRTTDLVLFVQDACSDAGCTDSSDSPERVTVDNAGASNRTFYIGVRGYSSTTGTFNIEFTYATPVIAANDNGTCGTATAVTTDITIINGDLSAGGARPTGTDCGNGSGARALYYAVTVPAGQRALLATDSSTDLVVFTQDACSDTDCTGAFDFVEEATVDNATGTAELTEYIGVRGYSSNSGTVDVSVTYTTPVLAANASCAAATAITTDTTITGEDISEGGARPTGEDCGSGSGPFALYYEVTVPAGQRVLATATDNSSLVVFAQDACGDVDCTNSSTSEQLAIDNPGAAERTFYVGVRGSSSTTGTFDIAFTYTTPIFAANDNDTCATATAISADITIVGNDTTLGGARPTATGCGFGTGTNSLYYAVTVPAGDRVVVTTVPDDDIVLFELPMCGAAACVAVTDSSPETLTYTNLSAAPVTHIFGVRPWSSSGTPTFDITFTYSTPVIPTNVSCATATVVAADTTFMDQATEFGGPRPTATDCGSGTGTNSLYYAVTVPAGDRVVVTSDPNGDVLLFELATCGAAACVAEADDPETLTFTNSTAAPVTHIFGVRPWGGSSTPTFGISFTYSTP